MRILITGASGQLGQALKRSAPENLAGEPLDWLALGRAELDLADADACRRIVFDLKPDWLINTAAYTAVDKAEEERELAWSVNAEAPDAFAETLVQTGGQMLQLSTDFVFNGRQGFPYMPEQTVNPLGVYGASKAEGELAVLKHLGLERRAHVLRTSWVYGPVGNNFLITMLRLHRERRQIRVVADQLGCPTSSTTLASACWRLLDRVGVQSGGIPPVLHWSDAGAASWYDFAVAIGEVSKSLGLVDCPAEVIPIRTVDYPTKACRPHYSLLECSTTREALDLSAVHWRKSLKLVLEELRN